MNVKVSKLQAITLLSNVTPEYVSEQLSRLPNEAGAEFLLVPLDDDSCVILGNKRAAEVWKQLEETAKKRNSSSSLA